MPTHPQPASAPPARPDSPPRRTGSQAGFSLIEVLVSALIVILMSVGTATALIVTSHTSGDQRLRSQANSLASQDQERLRGLSDEELSELNAANQTRTVTLNATSFTVKSATTYLDTTGTSSCTSSAAAYFKIVSTVSWTENFSKQSASVTEDSLLSRPVTGDLLATATDQTGAGLQGVTVSATGASNQTGATDSNGCTLFAGLTPGSYAVALSDNGYVDPNGLSVLGGTATVTLTGTASTSGQPFHLGLPGSIVGSFVTPSGLAGESDGLSWLGSGASYGMSVFKTIPTTDTSGALSTFTTSSLFPFDLSTTPANYTHNYTVWGGRCAAQEPPAPTDQVSVTPGSVNQAQSIQEPQLYVGLVYYKSSSGASSVAVAPGHISLSFTGGGCNDQWYAPVAPPLTPPATPPLTGWLLHPGQPYAAAGTLTVCADYLPSGSTYYHNSVTTSNTSFSATTPNSVPTITITKGATGSTNGC
jgi:Tfp pilus assembly protein PilV